MGKGWNQSRPWASATRVFHGITYSIEAFTSCTFWLQPVPPLTEKA